MVSNRQRLARKRFREANPDLFPKPQPPKEKKGKKEKNKKKNMLRKHPLRVPGMRPGESCFICKSKDHVAKLCPEKSEWEKNRICLLCRQRGHSLKNCQKKGDTPDKKFCYNCGEVGHSLSRCPLPLQDGGTKFANCFICNERGHLSKNCPKNTHGIYPKGGSCKICGGVTHLAKDCPNRGNRYSGSSTGLENTSNQPEGGRQGQRTIFFSGDGLEDDFMMEDIKNGKNDAISHSNTKLAAAGGEVEESTHVKPKKKQGPKVVKFIG